MTTTRSHPERAGGLLPAWTFGLVTCVLILGLFLTYMVVTPSHITPDPPVPLPGTKAPPPIQPSPFDVTLTVRTDGHCFLGDRHLLCTEVPAAITDIARATPGKRLLVRADPRLRYEALKEVLRATGSGFTEIVFVSEKRPRQR